MAKKTKPQKKSASTKNKASKKPKAKTVVKAKSKVMVKAKTKTQKKAQKGAAKKTASKKPTKMNAKATSAKSTGKTVSKATPKTSTAALANLFTPLDDRVLVEKVEVSDRTPGGLYIPDTVSRDDRSSQGKVVAVGRGHRDKKGRIRPLDVQLGDTVMFGTGGGSDVRIAEHDLLCLRENEIIAVIKS